MKEELGVAGCELRAHSIRNSQLATRNSPIGLLGGSFNPAHAGHLHISKEAIRRACLREVWWLVSPQNPLKSISGMAPFEERFAGAQRMMGRGICVSDIEQRLGTRYTVDTLRQLKRLYPHTRFVWLMGADNLAQLHRWQEWQQIARLVPIMVLDRAPHSHAALRSPAGKVLTRHRVPVRQIGQAKTPAFAYAHIRRSAFSSTALRNAR